MSALDSLVAASGEAPLAEGLDFTLPPSSTAIVNRQQNTRAYPTSASTLSLTGTRSCRIRLGGDQFADPGSVRLQFTITNTDAANPLAPACGPWGAIGQFYIRSNGVELTNLLHFGRWYEQYCYRQLSRDEQFAEAAVCGLAGSWNQANNRPTFGTIAAGASYTVMTRIPIGIFAAGKAIPLRYAPLEIEFTLADAADWLLPAVAAVAAGVGGVPPAVPAIPRSQTFTISNVQLLADMLQLDEAVEDSFSQALLAGRLLNIPVMTAYQLVQAVPAGSTFSFSCVRAFSRIVGCWLTFRNGAGANPGARSASFISPIPAASAGATPALTDLAAPLTCRLTLGPMNFPASQPIGTQCYGEFYYMMQKALPNIPNIDRDDFYVDSFTIAFNLCKVPGDPTTAASSRSGDQLWFDIRNMTPGAVTECWLTILAFGVISTRESGVSLLL
jgi:hypothetical protein